MEGFYLRPAQVSARGSQNHKNQAVNLRRITTNAMQRFYKFLVVFLFMNVSKIYGQSLPPAALPIFSLNGKKVQPSPLRLALFQVSYPAPAALPRLISGFQATLQPVNPDYYVRHFGVMCQAEYKFEKKTGLPLRFRLGSQEYADRLEGKTK